VTGNTFSNDFPTQYYDGAYNQSNLAAVWDYDAFVLMFNPDCESIWATYYGGTDPDDGYGIFRDNDHNLFVTGRTESEDFPILNWEGAFNQSTLIGNYEDAFLLKIGSIYTGVEKNPGNSSSMHLQCRIYPNPCNSVTSIEFNVSKASFIEMDIYNSAGQNIAMLINEKLLPGIYTVDYNATDLNEGIYYCVLKDCEVISMKKFIVRK